MIDHAHLNMILNKQINHPVFHIMLPAKLDCALFRKGGTNRLILIIKDYVYF